MAKIRLLFIAAVIAATTGTQVRPVVLTADHQPGTPIVADDGGKVGPTGG